MSTYSAVVTTGIYCRPGCPATPHKKNVQKFEFAAAAEAAGFRACMRCRPYRELESISTNAPEIVCKAVRLISNGALDDVTEEVFGRQLGVSARHLRRLFLEHVGTTPDQLARSRRAHFARRLLDDTDLTFTDVADASGFGSPRQLNRACQDIFHATPTELRSRRRKADRLVADGGLALRLPFVGPLEYDAMLAYHRRRAIAGVEHVDDDVYRRTIVVDGDPGVIEIHADGPSQLVMKAHLPHWEGLIHLVQQARRVFNLDFDVTSAHTALREDPIIGPLINRRPGLRMPGTWDPFEIGVRAIIGQQVSVAGANTITARLVAQHGKRVRGLDEFGLTHTFPTPRKLAKADLSSLGVPTARAAAIQNFARAVASGSIDLRHVPNHEAFVTALSELPGIGPWTGNYLGMRLNEPDAFPVGDLILQRRVAALVGHDVTARKLEEVSEAWKPWRAYTAIHLWLSE